MRSTTLLKGLEMSVNVTVKRAPIPRRKPKSPLGEFAAAIAQARAESVAPASVPAAKPGFRPAEPCTNLYQQHLRRREFNESGTWRYSKKGSITRRWKDGSTLIVCMSKPEYWPDGCIVYQWAVARGEDVTFSQEVFRDQQKCFEALRKTVIGC
jgi:hypothetical protein